MSPTPPAGYVRRPALHRAPAEPQARRAVVSGTAGSVLEWFDFAVYGAISATVFPVVFFGEMTPAGAPSSPRSPRFGVGIFARPLGGILFGHLGDKVGRRAVLLTTFITMGVSSAGASGSSRPTRRSASSRRSCSSSCVSSRASPWAARRPVRS